jgi:predicted dehydrogenase
MLNIGLAGYANWYHALAFCENLRKSEIIKIKSVFDSDDKKAQRLGEKSGGKVFTDFDKFIDSKIDAVILTGLPSSRLVEVKKLAKAKKHILIDKPISVNSSTAKEIIEICKKENVKLMVGYNLHWAQSLKIAYEIIKEGKLGKPVSGFYIYDGPMIQGTEWSPEPGWTVDPKEVISYWIIHADHGIELFPWILDGKYTDVYAKILNVAHPQYNITGDWGIGIFTMDNGAKIILKCDTATPQGLDILDIRIICEEGGILFSHYPEATLKIIGKRYTRNEMWEYKFKDHWQKGLAKMAEDFAICIMENKAIPITGEMGYRLMKAVEIAHLSSELDKTVKIVFEL